MSGEGEAISLLYDQIDALDDQLDEAADLLRGMVGLVQLIQHREPDLVKSHRYIAAVAWLEQYDGDRA